MSKRGITWKLTKRIMDYQTMDVVRSSLAQIGTSWPLKEPLDPSIFLCDITLQLFERI